MIRAVAVALALAAVPTALAGSVRTVTAAAPVSALAFDGGRVAFAEGRSARDCDRVRVWNLRTRGVSRLGRSTACVRTSTGTGIASVSIGGTRVLWLHYTGGNIREWSLFTATTGATKPRRLRFVARDVDAPPPIVVGVADGSRLGLLPYAVDRTVVALRTSGARAFSWTAPGRVLDLAADAGRLAVATDDGAVTILGATGRPVAVERFASPADVVRLARATLVVQRGRTLELRGDRIALFTLVGGVTLADADGDRAVLVGGGKVRTFDLDSGRGGVAANGSLARLDARRLATASGRLVSVR